MTSYQGDCQVQESILGLFGQPLRAQFPDASQSTAIVDGLPTPLNALSVRSMNFGQHWRSTPWCAGWATACPRATRDMSLIRLNWSLFWKMECDWRGKGVLTKFAQPFRIFEQLGRTSLPID